MDKIFYLLLNIINNTFNHGSDMNLGFELVWLATVLIYALPFYVAIFLISKKFSQKRNKPLTSKNESSIIKV